MASKIAGVNYVELRTTHRWEIVSLTILIAEEYTIHNEL